MRLINVRTLRLVEFQPGKIPGYAILSHRWLDEEISLAEFQRPNRHTRSKSGYKKIKTFCKKASEEGLRWAWVDTCCIDKSSSAELSEAINSMYRWYEDAAICLVHLSDVSDPHAPLQKSSDPPPDFSSSKWHTRGWTLQELLAPNHVRFYSKNWLPLGSKKALATHLSAATDIEVHILKGSKLLRKPSVAQRMSWASKRHTTRPEDIAYCLLGIFGVNMPMLYGEGDKAFRRLQEEIMKDSDDPTLFAWKHTEDDPQEGGLLARHPRNFVSSGNFVDMSRMSHFKHTASYNTVKRGISISLLMEDDALGGTDFPKAVLKCTENSRPSRFAQIQLKRVIGSENLFVRLKTLDLPGTYMTKQERLITVLHELPSIAPKLLFSEFRFLYIGVQADTSELDDSDAHSLTSPVRCRGYSHSRALRPKFRSCLTEGSREKALFAYHVEPGYWVSDPSLHKYPMLHTKPGEEVVKLEVSGLPGSHSTLIAIGLDQRGLLGHHIHLEDEGPRGSQVPKLPFKTYYDMDGHMNSSGQVFVAGKHRYLVQLVIQETFAEPDKPGSYSIRADLCIKGLPKLYEPLG